MGINKTYYNILNFKTTKTNFLHFDFLGVLSCTCINIHNLKQIKNQI